MTQSNTEQRERPRACDYGRPAQLQPEFTRSRSRRAPRVLGSTLTSSLAALGLFFACTTQPPNSPTPSPTSLPAVSAAAPVAIEEAPLRRASDAVARYDRLATELEVELIQHVLPFWFPKVIDHKQGGFFQTFNHKGERVDDGSKFVVFQARMLWVAAEVGARYPELRHQYEQYVEHGLAFMQERLWDAKYGGPVWELDAQGKPATSEKHAYGIAFAIYGAARAARLLEDEGAKELALKTYAWLDAHAHDPEHGGYFEALTAQGKPILKPAKGHESDGIGTQYGRKSMNTHLHLLEAVTELYRLAPSPPLRERLQELFSLMRDRVTDTQGYFHLYFNPDWTPVPGPESYGHSVEGAYLLLEAARELGTESDPETARVSRLLVDHALQFGWDAAAGGFFNEGEPSGKVTDSRKVWWVQAEGLNGLLGMHERHGEETSVYIEAFEKQWRFIQEHVSDRAHGEWWGYLGPQGELLEPEQQKANKWKGSYHDTRALMTSIAGLRRLEHE